MKRTIKLTGVPESDKDQIIGDYESEGATVSVKKVGATYTIVAEFEDATSSSNPVSRQRTTVDNLLGLAPGETERPKRAELEMVETGGPELHYPAAVRDLLGQMRTQGRYAQGYPKGAIVHFTAGRDNPRNDIRHALEKGYCYFVIGPDGVVYQNFPLDRWGSHAGTSYWAGLGSGVGQHLVGIEICNAGKLSDLGNGKFRPWYNEERHLTPLGRQPDPQADFPSDRVRHVNRFANRAEGHYLKFTELQQASLHTLLRWLHSNQPSIFNFNLVLGHDEVSPGRKSDPGGSLSMTMPELRANLQRGW